LRLISARTSFPFGQIGFRIDRAVIPPQFEMQFVSLGAAGVADKADTLAGADVVSFLDGQAAEEGIGRMPAVSMIDDDHLAELIIEAWRVQAPKYLRRQFEGADV